MNIIVIGCGRVGAELTYRLYQKGHQVVVIDENAAAFANLPPDFGGRTVEGEATNQEVLRRAGIEQADGLAAVTNSDSLNAVVAYAARVVYHVPNIVVRNYDPRWQAQHEAFGLQVVSSTLWGAQRIEQLLQGTTIRAVFSAGNGEVQLYEFVVPTAWHGQSLQDLAPSGDCRIVAATRGGRAKLASRGFLLEAGDVVHVSATLEGIEKLQQQLLQEQED